MIKQNYKLTVLHEGSKMYEKNGKRHRLSGPAMEYTECYFGYWGVHEYYVDDRLISKLSFYENYY